MKTIFISILFLLTLSVFSQSNLKVIRDIEKSKLFKGSISGSPVTMFLENKEIIDCDIFDTYIEGWYYYDKYKIKIPLSGFSKNCEMKLFNYGERHFALIKDVKEDVLASKIDSVFEGRGWVEELIFDRCSYDENININRKGSFRYNGKESEIIINANEIFIGKEHEYFRLPNSKQIDLKKIFRGYGGNQFFSMKQDVTENRAVFYFHSISNHNACGRCGASDGEKGFRIIYFDKNWNIINKQEYLIESCLEGYYDAKIISEANFITKYLTKDFNDKKSYLTIDKRNSKILKSNY